MTVAGGGWFTVGVVTLILLTFPFRNDRKWALYALPAVVLLFSRTSGRHCLSSRTLPDPLPGRETSWRVCPPSSGSYSTGNPYMSSPDAAVCGCTLGGYTPCSIPDDGRLQAEPVFDGAVVVRDRHE